MSRLRQLVLRRPRMSLRIQLVIGFGVVALLGLAALATTYLSHRTVRSASEEIRHGSQPLIDAADEMEISAGVTALAVTRYVEEGDPTARTRVREAAESFAHFAERAEASVSSPARRAPVTRARSTYGAMRVVGAGMMTGRTVANRSSAASWTPARTSRTASTRPSPRAGRTPLCCGGCRTICPN